MMYLWGNEIIKEKKMENKNTVYYHRGDERRSIEEMPLFFVLFCFCYCCFFCFVLFLCIDFVVKNLTEHFYKSIPITSSVLRKAEVKIKHPLH